MPYQPGYSRNPSYRTLQLIALLALGLFSGACSMIEFGYNQAPSLLASRIDDAFDLDSEQKKSLKLKLNEILDWHRQHEIPGYVSVLHDAANRAEDGVLRDDILWLVNHIRGAQQRLLARMIDDLASLALTLRPEQIRHYEEYRAEKFEEWREERFAREKAYNGSATAHSEHRLEQFERWIIPVEKDLKQRALARLAKIEDGSERWIAYRQARDRQFISALGSRTEDDMKRALRQALIDHINPRAEEFEPYRQKFWRDYADAIADILGWQSEASRQDLVASIREYAETAESLLP